MRIVEDLPQPEGPRILRNAAVRALDIKILYGRKLCRINIIQTASMAIPSALFLEPRAAGYSFTAPMVRPVTQIAADDEAEQHHRHAR